MDALADVLAANRIGGAILLRGYLGAPWAVRFDTADYAGFYVVERGACWLQMDRIEHPVRLVQGDVALLAQGSGHIIGDGLETPPIASADVTADCDFGPTAEIRFGGAGPETILLCGAYLYEHGALHPVLSQLPALIHVESSMAMASTELQSVLRLLTLEMTVRRAGYRAVVTSLIDMLFIYIVRSWVEAQPEGAAGWLVALRNPRMGEAISRIHREIGRPWTVESLASALGMSRAAFAREFAALIGEPPLTYITRWRMETAARLLRSTDEPLSRIAEQVGYESEYAFNKAFRRVREVSPGRYRRQARGAA